MWLIYKVLTNLWLISSTNSNFFPFISLDDFNFVSDTELLDDKVGVVKTTCYLGDLKYNSPSVNWDLLDFTSANIRSCVVRERERETNTHTERGGQYQQ